MPLDSLQFEILETLLPRRSAKRVVAGGCVLHRHAFRLSDDNDIFNADDLDVERVAKDDIDLLVASGFEVERSPGKHERLVECMIFKEGYSPTKLQWVRSGLLNFFSAVPDDVFGWRLHMVDIAVNKVLVAAARREARGFVDLAMIHQHVVPLWVAIWAAPGKDPGFNPLSLVERLARHNHFPLVEIEDAVDNLMPVDAIDVSRIVREALDEARDIIPRLPMMLAGNLFVDELGIVATDIDHVLSGLTDSRLRAVGPVQEGSWPSGPEIDRAILERIIDELGLDGSAIPEP